jgi:cation transport regulator
VRRKPTTREKTLKEVKTMEYQNKSDLPHTLRDMLPEEAQDIYLEAFQEAWEEYEDWQGGDMDRHSTAHQRAMAAVKLDFVHDDETGKWHRKGEELAEEDKGVLDELKDALGI